MNPTTLHLPRRAGKASYIRKLANEFAVVSEVGFKDPLRSEQLPPDMWIDMRPPLCSLLRRPPNDTAHPDLAHDGTRARAPYSPQAPSSTIS
jgi:hypothetical protein